MNRQVREDMLTVLEALGDRLWVPHQVLVEFWRNQQQPGVLGHHHRPGARHRRSHDQGAQRHRGFAQPLGAGGPSGRGRPDPGRAEQARGRP
ncbi:PIN-like domain-containing protein [Streptomyces sp. NPDC095614]|uniref:PIN-like domain-containing protein n=1 Tax=Streptomyces sp. NPDC095614 TaxID=3156692 RepID=UPI003318DD79